MGWLLIGLVRVDCDCDEFLGLKEGRERVRLDGNGCVGVGFGIAQRQA